MEENNKIIPAQQELLTVSYEVLTKWMDNYLKLAPESESAQIVKLLLEDAKNYYNVSLIKN